ncbi:MAG: LysM peptidoglycan-binding domain-containing protein [Pseudomonadota bacterium]
MLVGGSITLSVAVSPADASDDAHSWIPGAGVVATGGGSTAPRAPRALREEQPPAELAGKAVLLGLQCPQAQTGPSENVLEEEPLVSEELPDANPDAVLSTDTEKAGRIKEQARHLENEIKEEVCFDIPIVLNERVAYFLDYFRTVVRDKFSTWLSRSTMYLPQMKEVFRQQGLPEDLVYLALIESGFNPRAVSRSGAVGPWQFIRVTGHRYGLRQDQWVDERRDPEKATYAAAAYLAGLYKEFGSWYLAAAAYNCGEGRLRRAIRQVNTDDYWQICDQQALSRETQDYVPKMIAAILIAKEPVKYGFADLCYENALEWETVSLERPTDLNLIAGLCGTNAQILRDLNPELRRGWTPPAGSGAYELRVPRGVGGTLLAALVTQPDRRAFRAEHVVRRGETLAALARYYGCSIQAIMEANSLEQASLQPGQKLTVPAGIEGLAPWMAEAAADGQPSRAPSVSEANTSEPKISGLATYKVKRGDTLAAISRRSGLGLTEVRELNPHIRNDLKVGQIIKVKVNRLVLARAERNAAKQAITYRVRRGDTLCEIARRYNVEVQKLRVWNGLRKNEQIYPGDRLKVFAGLGG